MKFILSSGTKCPKSGYFTNNYWVRWVWQSNLQVSIAVFSGAVEKFLGQRRLSPRKKLTRTPMWPADAMSTILFTGHYTFTKPRKSHWVNSEHRAQTARMIDNNYETTVDKILITIILLPRIIFQLIAVENMGQINSSTSTFLSNLGRRICTVNETVWRNRMESLECFQKENLTCI